MTKKDIDKVVWNFWDGTTKTTNGIITTHKYSQSWAYGVKASIYTKDWQVIDNFITEKIIDSETNKKYWAYIKANPLKQNIWKKVNFTIIPDWFTKEDVEKIIWDFWDGTKTSTNWFKNIHTYYKEWKKNVVVNIILKNKDMLKVSLTEVIFWQNICLNKNNNLKCDMDKDGIPDMCDDDIDGDWIKNFIWLIKFENKDCSINTKNIDKSRLQGEQTLAKNGWDIDNCPFNKNPDQIDLNGNGIGDICENNQKDTDNDGIIDYKDACPNIPENINGVEDKDGCPEIWDINNEFSLKVDNCNTCPCHFADYWTPFIGWLNLKALLVNPYNPSIIYKISEPKTVK